MPNKSPTLRLTALSRRNTRGWLSDGVRRYPAALGRSGQKACKREGDGATPIGTWRILKVLYRADRSQRPRTLVPIYRISRADGWCDAPGDRNYNRSVRLPYPASAEALWRDDHLYDLIVVLDHNHRPRIRGGGSAIFMHIARTGYRPTEGCIALSAKDLAQVLRRLKQGSKLVIA